MSESVSMESSYSRPLICNDRPLDRQTCSIVCVAYNSYSWQGQHSSIKAKMKGILWNQTNYGTKIELQMLQYQWRIVTNQQIKILLSKQMFLDEMNYILYVSAHIFVTIPYRKKKDRKHWASQHNISTNFNSTSFWIGICVTQSLLRSSVSQLLPNML